MDYDQEFYKDTYTNMELALNRGDQGPTYPCVTKRLKDDECCPIGTANDNQIIDTRMYEVEYTAGYKTSLAANTIDENIFAQVDTEGNRHIIFDKIVDHCTDGKEINQQDAFTTNSKDVKRGHDTTLG